MTQVQTARFGLGQIVRHRESAFRGVVVDVDPIYAGDAAETGVVDSDQPFYQVLVLDADAAFIAYAAEEVLECDPEVSGLSAREERRWFTVDAKGHHAPRSKTLH